MRIDFTSAQKILNDIDKDIKQKDRDIKTSKSQETDGYSINEITQSNIASAKSRILDAEKAVNFVHLIKNQIEEEASSAIAAQANTTPGKVINVIS